MKTAEIPFTQYVMPDGRQRPVSIAVEPEVAAKAFKLIEAGLVFECEVLSTGEVSLTITDPEEGDDLAIEVIPNGPGVRETVEQMVRDFEQAA